MKAENILLSEMSQAGKAKNHIISLICANKTEAYRHRQQYVGYHREGGRANSKE